MKSLLLKKGPLFIWLITVFICLVLISLVLAAPIIHQRWPQLSVAIYSSFAPFCHQIKDRCFLITNEPLAVCARCFGIMAGFFIALIIYPLLRSLASPKPLGPDWLIAFSLPLAVDLAGSTLHLWSSPKGVRFVIGCSWGFFLPFYFFPAIITLWLKIATWKKN